MTLFRFDCDPPNSQKATSHLDPTGQVIIAMMWPAPNRTTNPQRQNADEKKGPYRQNRGTSAAQSKNQVIEKREVNEIGRKLAEKKGEY
jgi:hypothetical protein